MRAFILRVGGHFKRRQLFWLLFFVSAVLLVAHSYWSYQKTNKQVETYFQQIYEKKSLSQLEVFHNGLHTYLESYFERHLQFMWNFALDSQLGVALRGEDPAMKLQEILDRQRRIDGSFETLAVLDKKGILLAVSSDYANSYSLVGEDLSSRLYAKQVFETKDVAVLPEFMTLTGRKAIFFAAPVFDKAGGVEYVIVASETFSHFSRYLPIQSRFSLFQSLFLGRFGNIVLKDGEATTEKVNAVESDRIVGRLFAGEETAEDQEINYAGQKVFAQGSTLHFGSGNRFFLISYYPIDQFEAEAAELNQNMGKLFVRLTAQAIIVFGIFILILIFLIRRYEKNLR